MEVLSDKKLPGAWGWDYQKMVEKKLIKKDAAPTSLFVGMEVLRKTYVIKLQYCTPNALLVLRSPLFDAIKRLIGFQSVTLDVSSDSEPL